MKKVLGFSSLFIAAVSFGSFGLWIRILNQEMTIYQQIVLRNTFAFIIAILVIILSKQILTADWKKVNKLRLSLYTILIPISVILYNISILNTKIALATFYFYIGTILTGWLISIKIFKEKLNLEKWISLALVLIGLGLFVYPLTINSISLGLIMGILSGIIDAGANGLRKDLANKVNKKLLVLMTTVGGMLVSGFMILYFQQGFEYLTTISVNAWFVGVFFGGLLVFINYLLLIGFQNFDIGLGSIVLSLELVFALLIGMIFLNEIPTIKEILGGSLILLANVVPNINLIKETRKSK